MGCSFKFGAEEHGQSRQFLQGDQRMREARNSTQHERFLSVPQSPAALGAHAVLVVLCMVASVHAWAVVDYGPETCKDGYVWREACGPNDHVCVTSATRTQAAKDNSQAAVRRQSDGGAYGRDTCRHG